MSTCDGFIFVCDVNNYVSFNEVRKLLTEVSQSYRPSYKRTNSYIVHDAATISIVVAINKADLNMELPMVCKILLEHLSEQYPNRVVKTSAKTGHNVGEVFRNLVDQMRRSQVR